MTLWEIVLMVFVIKIPIAYVLWVIWWAIRAEPEVGTEGGTEGVNWAPWRRRSPKPIRPERGAPRGIPTRSGPRERQRARGGRAAA
jgi:hypothetical protein